MEPESLEFKAHAQRLAIACIAASPLREILILHGGSAFAYCHGGGRVPKDVDFRMRSEALGRLATSEVMQVPSKIGAVLSEQMPKRFITWASDSDRIKRVLHVDLFTIARSELGVVELPVETDSSLVVAAETLPLALANKCYLLFGLAQRPGSATDLFDVADATRRVAQWPQYFVEEIASAVIRLMARRAASDDQRLSIDKLSRFGVMLRDIGADEYERVRKSVLPGRWVNYDDAVLDCHRFCESVAAACLESGS